ncbi:phage-related baseplate assembly protein [Sporomusaceae bacterium BoRhaA]|uniref:baseplate assembly protein n=1 Tax=Pelorhabdus rhamnosifermentans TaxID=2772457 RepID=UPI001FE61C52|nr:baseplate J/gp47 family protein [Pelorhabdus rhamnosifermentans]MBU2701695.1 phage-related baseplate assembly protein [Pelorhabdus rhamnosifermentans]
MSSLSNLPSITFAEKDASIIETDMINTYEQTSGQTLADADPRKKLLQSEVPIITGQRSAIDYSAKQNLLAYARKAFLDHIGILVGCTRIPATAASDTVRFTLSIARIVNTPIAAGKRVTAGDNIFFATTIETVIPAGTISADILVQCMTTGALGNGYAPGTLNTLVDPIPYVASVSNTTTSQGGVDIESDDAFRDRIQQAPESFSTAGPDGAYKYWAKTASSLIADVKPYSPSPGVVNICILLANGEIPGQEMLDAVLAICNDKKIRPLTDKVQAVAPTQVSYNIDVAYWIDQQNASVAASIQKAVQAAVNDYILWQKSALGRGVDPSQLIYLMKQAGAERVAVTAPAYQALTDSQVAKEGTIAVNYSGTEATS